MAWSSDINNSHSSGASSIYALKVLLETANWTVLEAGDGRSAYSSGDGTAITSAGSGDNGLDNQYAWFRIEDPGSNKEFVFQRGANNYSWKILYSKSDGFTGGPANATTIPTATDQQGIAKGSTSEQTLFPTSGSWYCHIAAQDTMFNNIYPFWLATSVSANDSGIFIYEALDNVALNDVDEAVFLCTNVTRDVIGSVTSMAALLTDQFFAWNQNYNDETEFNNILPMSMSTYSSAYQIPLGNGTMSNPEDGYFPLFNIGFFRWSTYGSNNFYKGVSKYIRWNPSYTNVLYGDLFLVGSDHYYVHGPFALPGWPDSTIPS